MNAHADDRAPTDADPAAESWLYRSEGFAEDLDDSAAPTTPVAVARAAQRRPVAGVRAPWSAALAGLWQARAQGAR